MKNNKFILLTVSFIMGIILIPNNVFAAEVCNSGGWNGYCSEKEETLEALAFYLNNHNDFNLLELNKNNAQENIAFTYAFNAEDYNASSGVGYDEKIHGFKLKHISTNEILFDDQTKVKKGPAMASLMESSVNSRSGLIDYVSLIKQYPYYIYFTASGKEYLYFFKSKDIYLKTVSGCTNGSGGTATTCTGDFNIPAQFLSIYVKDVSSDSGSGLGIGFRKSYASIKNPTSIYNAYIGGLGSPRGELFRNEANDPLNYKILINNSDYYFMGPSDFILTSSDTLQTFLNSSNFISNANIVDSSGSSLHYSNHLDLTTNNAVNSSDIDAVNPSPFPTSLPGFLEKIPSVLSTLVSSFSLIGTLIGIFFSSFPPIVVTCFYTLFLLGIIIVIIKTLR